MRYPRHGKQFADLLESNLCLPARNHCTDSFTSTDKPALACHLVGNSQALIQLRG